jgi:sn-glycerol 3-phosphate transport system permease protein
MRSHGKGRVMARRALKGLLDHAILIVGVIVMMAPVVQLMVMSLSSPFRPFAAYEALATRGFGFSGEITLWSMLVTSLVSALSLGFFKTLFAAMAAYGLVFFRVRLAEFIFFSILITLYLPLHARPVPTYLVAAQLGLTNSRAGLVMPLLASGLGVLLFRQFLRQLPNELAEAAQIDGAGPVKFFIDCVLPVSAPFLAALFAIHFIEGWHQYLWPLMSTSAEELTTVTKGLQLISVTSPAGLALAVVALFPPLVLVLILGPIIARSLHFDSVDH